MPKTLPLALVAAAVPLLSVPARAEVDMNAARAACQGDVLRLCPTTIFDRGAIIACMHQNRAALSPSCGAIFDKGTRDQARHPAGSVQ